jgi:hypothetical protein
MIYYFNMFGCLAVAWLLTFAVIIDRKHIRRAWKPAMVFLIIEQGVLAYGCIESLGSGVAIEVSQILFMCVLFALVASLLIVVITLRNPSSWWFGRDSYSKESPIRKSLVQSQDSESQSPSRYRAPVRH